MPSDPALSEVRDDLAAIGGTLINLQHQYQFPGFAGVVADVPAGTLYLYWVTGEPLPPPVEQVVTSPGRPVSVVRRSAAYGKLMLDARADVLMADPGLSNRICGLLHRLTVPEEGYGLTAGVQPWPGFSLDQASATLSALVGVPVTVEVSEPVTPLAANRQQDTPPWSAGAHLTTDGKMRCSSAFGVIRNVNRLPYLLTAAHCFAPGAKVFNGPDAANLREVGIVRDHLPGLDSALIEVTNLALVSPTVYSGPWNSGNLSAVLATVEPVVKGVAVCASGATTGRNCGQLVVTTDARTINPLASDIWRGRFQWVTGLFKTQTLQVLPGGFAAPVGGQGDSGGPVIRYNKDGMTVAQGTISFGSDLTLCGASAVPTRCFSTGFYADVNNLLQVYGISL